MLLHAIDVTKRVATSLSTTTPTQMYWCWRFGSSQAYAMKHHWSFTQVTSVGQFHCVLHTTPCDIRLGLAQCQSARLPPMWPGFDSRTRRHMWAEFVGSLLCSERFFSGYSGYPLSSKTKI